jgi:hypothetical protein
MPIKFRCPVCEGMLSIARRKAGTQVLCPKCGDEVTVPDADLASGDFEAAEETEVVTAVSEPKPRATGNGSAKKSAEPPLFERGTLDQLLATPDKLPAAPVLPKPPSSPLVPDVAAPAEEGIYVSRGTLIVLGLLVVVLIALAFATGFLIGS